MPRCEKVGKRYAPKSMHFLRVLHHFGPAGAEPGRSPNNSTGRFLFQHRLHERDPGSAGQNPKFGTPSFGNFWTQNPDLGFVFKGFWPISTIFTTSPASAASPPQPEKS